ncbi:MAG: GNAT family N-acetyltransferase [bacterium]
MADALIDTAAFFSAYLECDLSSVAPREMRVVASDRRERRELLYADVFALWLVVFENRAALSVQSQLYKPVRRILGRHGIARIREPRCLDDLTRLVETHRSMLGQVSVASGPINCCAAETFRPRLTHPCRAVTEADLPAVRQSGLYEDWLEQSVRAGTCHAAFDSGRPVALCGTFDVPHLADRVADIGLAGTLDSHRRLGFGSSVLSATTAAILAVGKTPVHQTSDRNVASIATARSVGYREFGWDFRVRITPTT